MKFWENREKICLSGKKTQIEIKYDPSYLHPVTLIWIFLDWTGSHMRSNTTPREWKLLFCPLTIIQFDVDKTNKWNGEGICWNISRIKWFLLQLAFELSKALGFLLSVMHLAFFFLVQWVNFQLPTYYTDVMSFQEIWEIIKVLKFAYCRKGGGLLSDVMPTYDLHIVLTSKSTIQWK